MKRKTALPELLAPAGDTACLRAAVAAGADAVYLGGVRFGARAFAKNFDEESLRSAVRYAHAHGVRIYVTLNTLIYDKELSEAVEYAKTLHGMGVDALIVADIGVISAIRRAVPELPLHASTQMGVHNLAGAEMAAALGCERVVLARECSAKDIKAVTERSRRALRLPFGSMPLLLPRRRQKRKPRRMRSSLPPSLRQRLSPLPARSVLGGAYPRAHRVGRFLA